MTTLPKPTPNHMTAHTSPLRLPDVDMVARAIYESDRNYQWGDETASAKDVYRTNAQAALDLVAAHQPVWKRVEPGTLIKAGTRIRIEWDATDENPAEASERTSARDATVYPNDPARWYIDPRTIPAPTLTERIRAALNDSPESRITLDVADVEDLLDMVGGDPR